MRTNRSLPRALLLALGLGAGVGCGPSTPVEPDQALSGQTGPAAAPGATDQAVALPADMPAPRAVASLAEMAAATKGDPEFALSLYSRVESDGNVLISPGSARIALAMAHAGARGSTAEQMARALVMPDDPRVHEAFGAILGQWQSWASVAVPSTPEQPRQPFQLRVANRLFGQTGRPFLPAYLALLTEKYGAPLVQLDFGAAPEPSRQQINQWVEEHTEKRIKDLVPSGGITPDTRLVLVNALYFKADWERAFDKGQTRDGDFAVTAQTTVKVPMMHQTATFRHAETADAQVLEMPYLGAPMAMIIVLPKAKDGLSKLEASLSPAALDGYLGQLAAERVHVQLPKFKVESSFQLAKVLGELGMTDALTRGKADFSGMDGTRELFLGEVIQKTFCAVDEQGTEAAAATAVVMRTTSLPSGPPHEFVADHPFLFMIRDTRTGSLLFLGRLARPA